MIKMVCLYSGKEHTPVEGNLGIIYCAECGEILKDTPEHRKFAEMMIREEIAVKKNWEKKVGIEEAIQVFKEIFEGEVWAEIKGCVDEEAEVTLSIHWPEIESKIREKLGVGTKVEKVDKHE